MLRLIHNQTVAGGILINDIDDGLPNKTAKRGVARAKLLGDSVAAITKSGVGDTFNGPFSGTGDSLTVLSGVVTLVDAGASFVVGDVGKRITISGATNPENDGTFVILSRSSGTTITFANPIAITETSSFTYLSNDVSLVDAGGSFTPQNVGSPILISGASNAGNNGEFTIVKIFNGLTIILVNSAGVTETSAFNYSILGGIKSSANFQHDGSSLGTGGKSTLPGVNYPKQKCYIPKYKITGSPSTHDITIAGYIDVTESDRVLISQNQGVIAALAATLSGHPTYPLITVTSFTAADVAAPTITTATVAAGGSYALTLVGTNFTSLAPDVSSVRIGSTTITAAAIVLAGGTFAATSIIIPEALVPLSLIVGTTTITVTADNQTTAPHAIAVSNTAPVLGAGAAVLSTDLTLTGTGFRSILPNLTSVIITGDGAVTLTAAQILGVVGGSITDTTIVIKASLIPGVATTTSSAQVSANALTSAVRALV